MQANILSALSSTKIHEVFNIALGDRTSLNDLFALIKNSLNKHGIHYTKEAIYGDFREGDVLHSQADISKAKAYFGYEPTHRIGEGIEEAAHWFTKFKKY